jgi:hypothetical protein
MTQLPAPLPFPSRRHRSSPADQLPGLERRVIAVLRDARGFYRTSGMDAAEVWRRLDCPSDVTEQEIEIACRALVGKGFAEVGRSGFRVAVPRRRASK